MNENETEIEPAELPGDRCRSMERAWAFTIAAAFIGGFLALPALLVIAALNLQHDRRNGD